MSVRSAAVTPGRHRAAPGDGRPRPTVTRRRGAAADGVRTDIQALRALAVGLVVVYHLWPGRLRGGFVGVDVFFVISGFLITAHLLRHPPRRPVDLLQFWSRRIRRLLPASLSVLLTTLVATRLVAPDGLWRDTADQVRAAALYVVNWTLAGQQVDYLNPASPPTPVQHFWSLSVEEQFYLGWPVLLAALCALAVRWRGVVLAGVVLVVAGSLAWSIHLTASDPTSAYFATTTRVWELGVGGALAAWAARGRRARLPERLGRGLRIAACWAGLGLVAVVAFTYTDATPFPGWQAALPVGGAALVIAAAVPRGRLSPAAPMAVRPVQYLGDISYSVYLWHWPLIILAPSVSGGSRGPLDDVAILAATLVLAALTKRFVEDRFRTPAWGRSLPRPYALAAAAMVVVVVGAQLQLREITVRERDDAAAAQAALAGGDPCYGAAAVRAEPGACTVETPSGRLLPGASEVRLQRYGAAPDGSDLTRCFTRAPDFPLRTCRFGPPAAPVKVALLGNSHAAQWLPAVRVVADTERWQVTTFVAGSCAAVGVPQGFVEPDTRDACRQWTVDAVDRIVRGGFDLVVLSNLQMVRALGADTATENEAAYRRGYVSLIGQLTSAGAHLLTIRDTPKPGGSVPACLLVHDDDYRACAGTRAAWFTHGDATSAAVRDVGRPTVRSVDLTELICPTQRCPAVIGRVPVYFDDSHLSAAFARTLAPFLRPALLRTLAAT